jgi:hypothetical protein
MAPGFFLGYGGHQPTEAASVTNKFVSSSLPGQSDTAEAFADREQPILPGNIMGS